MRILRLLIVFIAACLAASLPATARAVNPESPEVKAVIEKGLKFLETGQLSEHRLGGHCLIGLCFLKNGRNQNHPKVQAAVASCQQHSSPAELANVDVYSNGIALMFLIEADPTKYRDLIQKYLQQLLNVQKSHGGWGYGNTPTGDTSQTQYAALGLWMAKRNGFTVPQSAIEKLCGWLMRTQDPSGAWGYQGNDPGSLSRVNQSEVRASLAAAGAGSIYISADLLEISDPQGKPAQSETPSALQAVEEKKRSGSGNSRVINAEQLRLTMADGNRWLGSNYKLPSEQWTHYFLYGFERYMSYRALVEQRKEETDPEWYNIAFDFLQKTQKSDGSWEGDENAAVTTCFAILCLSRTSQKTIQKVVKALGEGVLLGGMGLPPNTADLQERNGKVVATPLAGSAEELIRIIEDPNNPELSRLAEYGSTLTLDDDITKRSGQIARLRASVSAESFEARIVAVRTLSKVRELDNVPVLLYALTDPDIRVIREADKGLRFISRKFKGVGLPDEAPTEADLRSVRKAWQEWYKSIRPDAELLE